MHKGAFSLWVPFLFASPFFIFFPLTNFNCANRRKEHETRITKNLH